MKTAQRHTGVVGWVALLGLAAVYDILVIKTGKESLSGAIWTHRNHQTFGPAIAGTWTALTWHFFFSKPKGILLQK